MSKKNDKDSLFCSFCGKNQKEVKKLIAGPTVFVCDECVELCMDIIKEDNKNNKFKIKKDIPKPSEINKFLNDSCHSWNLNLLFNAFNVLWFKISTKDIDSSFNSPL